MQTFTFEKQVFYVFVYIVLLRISISKSPKKYTKQLILNFVYKLDNNINKKI